MRENTINFAPFQMTQLLDYTGFKKENEHGYVKFSGIIDSKNADPYMEIALEETWVICEAVDDNGAKKTLFHGVLTDLYIKYENQVHTLYAEVRTGSYLMDHEQHIRTFQDSALTYRQVQESYINNYPNGSFIMTEAQAETIGKLITQYHETDWGFLKRIASHFNTFVVPDYNVGGVKYFFGMPDRSSGTNININSYTMKKSLSEYKYKKDNKVQGIAEKDAIYHIFTSREIYDLGENILLNGSSLYISIIETKYVDGELYHTYYLKTKNGFKVPKTYNKHLIGASLSARILDVQKDVVQISCDEDENKDKAGTRWFAYSTPYSTPDGTGWYAMPEIGDAVRLYVPDEDEPSAYVHSSTHLEPSASDERIVPDYKSFMNKYGKEVLFKPTSLTITNNSGQSIELLDDEGIRITSNKALVLKSDESVSISSATANLQVIAPESIVLQQGQTRLVLKEDIVFSGAQMHMD